MRLTDKYEELLEITPAESLGETLKIKFENREDSKQQAMELYSHCMNGNYDSDPEMLADRTLVEENYHQFLLYGLVKQFEEMSHYDPNFNETSRRIMFSNSECISLMQLLVRDELHFHVYMRSSHLIDCLPADLLFLTDAAYQFFHLKKMQRDDQPLNFQITFGSLHRKE